MASPEMLCCVALVRTDVSKKLSASIIRVTRMGDLGATLAVMANVDPSSPILVTPMKEALSSSETSVLTTATRRNIQEDAIVHEYCTSWPIQDASLTSCYLFPSEVALNEMKVACLLKCHNIKR
jgi:hypothetical protein